MSSQNHKSINAHEDVLLFKEAVRFTAVRTGFTPSLIEKDYFCSLILSKLAVNPSNLIFKGGTCLAKVHAEFYRLSEDLDFTISMPVESTRSQRRKKVAGFKNFFQEIEKNSSVFTIHESIRGSNMSRHYAGTIAYKSHIIESQETIKIEVGLREPVKTQLVDGPIRTVLLNPVSSEPFVTKFVLPCISKEEAFAEKLRAALTRREVAIRDFFDIDYAVRHLGLQLEDRRLITMLKKKLAVPGNDPVDLDKERLDRLRSQLYTRLRTVLRDDDFKNFDLERAIEVVVDLGKKL
jgi:predicted nucleotidyltransferase component of viral defense system